MLRNLIVFYALCVLLCAFADESTSSFSKDSTTRHEESLVQESTEQETMAQKSTEQRSMVQESSEMEPRPLYVDPDMLSRAMQGFIFMSQGVSCSKQTLPEETFLKIYDNMLHTLDHIMELLKDPANINRFIEENGLETITLPETGLICHTEMHAKLLALLKLVFESAPLTASIMAPVKLLDSLLNTFIRDDTLPLKSSVIDILTIWLPDNPRMQAKVMKDKGLEPLYDQMHKLGADDSMKMIKLFNYIVKEHLDFRSEMLTEPKETRSWLMKANIYKSIGLIERLGTSDMCNGLLEIYQLMWMYSVKDRKYMLPVFELMKMMQAYCEVFYVGDVVAAHLFQEVQKNLQMDSIRSQYEAIGVNATDVEVVLKRYIEKATSKDEL